MTKILTIIITYNGMQWIDRCLNSVIQSSVHSDILVIDNGSTDNTVNHILANYTEIELIKTKINLGFGLANNIGLKRAVEKSYDYAYLLNQDAWIEKDTLKNLIAIQVQNPEYGILSPLQTDSSGNHLDKNFVLACTDDMLSDACCNVLKSVYPTNIVMAAHWLISQKCLLTTGGFSPVFPHYGEDNNYAQRARYHGFKIGIVTTTKGVHDRYDRKTPKSKVRYLRYIDGLIMLSNPEAHGNFSKLTVMYLKSFLKQPSFDYIKYYIRTIKNRNMIRSCLNTSINKGAFIQQEQMQTNS